MRADSSGTSAVAIVIDDDTRYVDLTDLDEWRSIRDIYVTNREIIAVIDDN